MDEYDLRRYQYGAVSGKTPKQLVILLHGLGSDGRDLIELAPFFAQGLPDAVFISPDAPYPCDMSPLGYQWFSLQDRDDDKVQAGVKRADVVLSRFIEQQMEAFDIPAEQTVLVGFSQGTMMSLYTAPRFPQKLAGVLGYSGALIDGEELGIRDDIFKLPIHLIHGDRDDVVPVERYDHAKDILEKSGFPVTGVVRPGLTHSIDQEGIMSGRAFLQQILISS